MKRVIPSRSAARKTYAYGSRAAVSRAAGRGSDT
jgi:hypothetical protein